MKLPKKIKPHLIALLLCGPTPLWAADAEPATAPVPYGQNIETAPSS